MTRSPGCAVGICNGRGCDDRVCGCLRYQYSNEESSPNWAYPDSRWQIRTTGWALEAAVYGRAFAGDQAPGALRGIWRVGSRGEIRGPRRRSAWRWRCMGSRRPWVDAIGISTRHSDMVRHRFSGASGAALSRMQPGFPAPRPMTILNTAARWKRCDSILGRPIHQDGVWPGLKDELDCARFRSPTIIARPARYGWRPGAPEPRLPWPA